MPRLDGLEAAKILKSKYGDRVRIFIITGNVFAEELTNVVDGVLLKPCTKEQLIKCCQI